MVYIRVTPITHLHKEAIDTESLYKRKLGTLALGLNNN